MLALFVNYVADRTRNSPVNLTTARVLLGTYLIWKILSYRWTMVTRWPLILNPDHQWAVEIVPWWFLPVEQWLASGVLVLFVLGYRIQVTSWLSALFVAHLGVVRFTLTSSGATDALLISTYLLIFFGLAPPEDTISYDTLRQNGNRHLDQLNDRLTSSDSVSYSHTPLVYGLVALSLVYFGSAFQKAIHGPLLEWATAENMIYTLTLDQQKKGLHTPVMQFLADFVANHRFVATGLAWGTILLEGGLLPAVLGGVPITAFALGLIGMHVGIALAMGPVFADNVVFLLLFISWDRLHRRFQRTKSVEVIYDERSPGLVRLLYIFKLLDVRENITFLPRSIPPNRHRTEYDRELDDSLFVIQSGERAEGYDGVVQLVVQFRHFAPVAWLLTTRPVVDFGIRAYRFLTTA